MHKRLILLLVLLVIIVTGGYSRIMLPSVISDNMVLQQNAEVALWGWADPAEKIRIVAGWNNTDTVTVIAGNDTKWKTTLKTINAGGPYTITLIGSSRIELKNVMLGEVWICSGQSNMEMSVNWGIQDGEAEAAKANHPNIRFFHVAKRGSGTLQDDCTGSWEVCTPQSMRATSAVGYFFGRELMEKLNVPVGLIVSAWGGTPAEVWIPKEEVENDPLLFENRITKEYAWWPSVAGTTYNSMIHPLIPYGISGAIWYQGEANCSKPDHYSRLMQTLIESWRRDFGKQFPFYYVQIAPYTYGEDDKAYLIREQQAKLMVVPQTGMVVVSDLVDNVKDIHPKNKQDVGKRLAGWALNETYGIKTGNYKSPMYEGFIVNKGKMHITFKNATDGLVCTSISPEKFLIAGEDQKFYPAQAKIEGNTVLVYSKSVKNPVAVRFCFDNATMPDLFGKSGLPVAPFRTDNW